MPAHLILFDANEFDPASPGIPLPLSATCTCPIGQNHREGERPTATVRPVAMPNTFIRAANLLTQKPASLESWHTMLCGYDAVEFSSPCECPAPAVVNALAGAFRALGSQPPDILKKDDHPAAVALSALATTVTAGHREHDWIDLPAAGGTACGDCGALR